jgi:tetratricopeptide (TPR) repeat protein
VAQWVAIQTRRGPLAEQAAQLAPRLRETMQAAAATPAGARAIAAADEKTVGWLAYGIGCTYAGAGFADEAVDVLSDLHEQRAESLPILIGYAEALDRADRWDEAPEVFDSIAAHERGSEWGGPASSVLHRGGLLMLEAGLTERAAPLLRRAVELGGDAHPALPALAAALLDMGDAAAAQACYERALGAAPDDAARASLLLELADVAARRLDNPGQAEARYREALALVHHDGAPMQNPLERVIRVRLLDCLVRLGRWAEVAREAQEVIASTDDLGRRARYEVAAARAYREVGDLAAEEKALRSALAHDPGDAAAFAALLRRLEERNEWAEVADLLSTRADAAPSDRRGPASRGAYLKRYAAVMRDRLGDRDSAISALSEACELDPTDAAAAIELAALYTADARDLRAAIEAHRRAVRADPSRVESILALAELGRRVGREDLWRAATAVGAAVGACEAPPPNPLEVEPAKMLGEVLARELVHPDAAALGGVFRSLFDTGGLLFRQQLAELGVKPEDRISPVSKEPVARAFLFVNRAFPVKTLGLFRTAGGSPEDPAQVAATNPPAVLGRSDADADERVLRFHLGRAMQGARPEFVLPAALPEDRLRPLFEGLYRAFAPSAAPDELASPLETVAKVVERLRNGIPRSAAARIEAVLGEELPRALGRDYQRWRVAFEATLNRAGLVACGDPGIAIRIAAVRAGWPPGDAPRAGLAALATLRDLVTFALSEEYLATQRALTTP